ncbi:MAG: AraC family transcriptional regulator [Filimonas sp.]|nr:AraC family transcriptional regulator [Filimonas sp.]
MSRAESLREFYQNSNAPFPESNKAFGHFNVYRREEFFCRPTNYSRRDFYKISYMIGSGTLYYADKGITIDQPALLFSNPNVPYSWEASSEEQKGYFCLFTEGFFNTNNRNENLNNSPIFKIGSNPVYFLAEKQQALIASIFERMLEEIDSEYIYKYDLLHNYTSLIIHEALKMKPADTYFTHQNAASRIATLFVELLERQFPIDNTDHSFQLKSANDYATRLSVHVNHLNRAVKEVTGKTTTELISERIIKEAKALLIHTDWNVSQIAYSLGFEYPAYFNNFFKKQTSMTPRTFRN